MSFICYDVCFCVGSCNDINTEDSAVLLRVSTIASCRLKLSMFMIDLYVAWQWHRVPARWVGGAKCGFKHTAVPVVSRTL